MHTSSGQPAAAHDLVLSLAFETYTDTVRRSAFSPDLLVQHLLTSERVDRLLVADPWRSVLGLLRRDRIPFPADARRHHTSPRRLRRTDPTDVATVRGATRRYLARVRGAAERAGLEHPVLLATHPWVAAEADPGQWQHVAYYGWDDWAAHPAFAPWHDSYLDAYARMRERGVRVVGVTDAIVRRAGAPAGSATVPNGLIADEWREPAPAPQWFLDLERPRLLYTGTVDTRLDLDTVEAVCRSLDAGSLTVVGQLADDDVVARLRRIPRVHVQSWQPRVVTRGVVAACDLALIPHVTSDLTVAMSPLKLYEYLAAGRPVVASDLPAIRAVPGVVTAATVEDFVHRVHEGLRRGPASEPDRLAFIEQNTWGSRFETLLDVVL